jgi:hypothetical protein
MSTQKEKVREYVEKYPGKTAIEIAKATELRAANVSSVLVKGFYNGLFTREKPDGSKGWVYAVAPPKS